MKEIWRPILNVRGNYIVSNLGRVMNQKNGRILVPRSMPSGYLRVHLLNPNGTRDQYIHRLVAEAFCVHPYGCNVINHIDNNRANNAADNLEWTTQRKNVLHAMNQGRVPTFPNALKIIGIKNGIQHIFSSAHEAAEYAHCDSKTVLRGCKTGRKTRSGFIWKVA